MSTAAKLRALYRAAGRSIGGLPLESFVSTLKVADSPASTAIKPSATLPAKSSPKSRGEVPLSDLILEQPSDSEDSSKQSNYQAVSILLDGASNSSPVSEEIGDDDDYDDDDDDDSVDIPWLSRMPSSNTNVVMRRKEMSRERKMKWHFKKSQVPHFKKLINMCGEALGTDATVQVLGRLGRETGVKEFNALIALCIVKARTTDDEDVALEEMSKAFGYFKIMRERGFQLEEETYGPLLMYFIERGMIEEFNFFCGPIRDGDPKSLPRLGYYEMLLWISVDDDEMIQELCDYIADNSDDDDVQLKENYLLALCESERRTDLLRLLKIIDITKVSAKHAANIFKTLGRMSLESYAKKFLLAFKSLDSGAERISTFIFSYVSCIPNLAAEDVVLKYETLHKKFGITQSLESYEELIKYCCGLEKVQLALDIVERICGDGLSVSINTINCILHASEEIHEYNLVRRVYSVVCCHNLKPNAETFRSMISSCAKMKDFDGAYAMLNDSKKMNVQPIATMYNAIMAGYFREKNIPAGLRVLKQMELDGVKPDPQTYSYLIGFCDREEDIIKYYEELKEAGIPDTKHILMSLINAYAAFGQFEKAKQVIYDKERAGKSLIELKSTLLSALASNGQMVDALSIYEEIKKAGANPEPKAVISLIEFLQAKGDLNLMLELLEKLHDQFYWVDGCFRIVTFCARKKHLSSAIDLLKQLKQKFCDDELAAEVLFDEAFAIIAEGGPADVKFGMNLLQAIKKDVGISPSRKCLDFLLNACVKAKDLRNALLIWKEYEIAGLPYNVINFLRMYQVLLACGDHEAAKVLHTNIPKDDPHVQDVIQAFQATYTNKQSKKTEAEAKKAEVKTASKKKKKKKKKKKNKT